MIPVLCAGIILVDVIIVVGCHFAPHVAVPCSVLLVLYLAWFTHQSYGDAEVHDADAAARILYEAQAGRTPELPEKLKGVFWMSTNAASELLATFEGSEFDPESNTFKLRSGAPLNWSYSTGTVGWIYWAFLRLSYPLCSKLHFRFDPEYTSADMPLYMCNCVRMPMGMTWTMEQIDENNWDRNIYFCWSPDSKSKYASYILRRVIDGSGNELPALQEMMTGIEQRMKVKGCTEKPMQQIINGWPGGGGCCGLLPGPDAWRNHDNNGCSSESGSSWESSDSSD